MRHIALLGLGVMGASRPTACCAQAFRLRATTADGVRAPAGLAAKCGLALLDAPMMGSKGTIAVGELGPPGAEIKPRHPP
jgi:3-hydroxyisobutyrate dehydrogenase-like beta-hydroxyacid dehydrogenase